ncbi:MAG: alpha/beta fold hydrolase [Candidatus Sericytochromatia bacterium]|nr:alpha/beta fold hydrolase [Candidatus Tanganyikabacteria bacterium]
MSTAPSSHLIQDLQIAGEPDLMARLYQPGGTVVAGAVLAHGFASRADEFGALPAALAARGVATLAFDFRGHGASGGERSYNTGPGQDADLARAVRALCSQSAAAAANLFLVGHSVGTAPVLRLLADPERQFAGGVLLAPVAIPGDAVSPGMRLFYEAAYAVARQVHGLTGIHLHVPYQFDYPDLFADPDAARRAAEQGFLQRTVSLLNLPYLTKEINNVSVAARVAVPALVVVGSEDRVIPNVHSRAVFEALGSEDKEWVRVVGAGHSFLGDRGAAEACGTIVDWIAARIAGADR